MSTRTWKFGTSEASMAIGGNQDNNLLADILGIGTAALPLIKDFLG